MSMQTIGNVVDILKEHEGFRGSPYVCTEGHPTIGYGTKLPLTETEAEILMIIRLEEQLLAFFHAAPEQLQSILQNHDHHGNIDKALGCMIYQLGVSGTLGFKKMIQAIIDGDFEAAAREAMDSKWARQTPARAEFVRDLFLAAKNE